MPVDMSALAGTVSALKGAVDITKAIVDLRDSQAIQAKVLELNHKIIDAQCSALAANDERTALIDEVARLKQQIADLETWGREKERYQLTDIGNGKFTYVLKPESQGTEPAHQICAHCYQTGTKSILQTVAHLTMRAESLYCHKCDNHLYTKGAFHPDHVAKKNR